MELQPWKILNKSSIVSRKTEKTLDFIYIGQNILLFDRYHGFNLCTCTNEPSGEDLCARLVVWE